VDAIVISDVYKIFGPTPDRVLDRVRAGASKEDILEQTGHTVGVRGVTLTIEAGKCSVVMGLSGSGKSTLLRHLNRLIEPTAGAITVDGEDIMALDERALQAFRRQKMSMVFQRFGLMPHKTVIENVAYGLDIRASGGRRRQANRDLARHWIEVVGLTGYEDQYPSQLSGGMQQRVGLARALATDADILLMDEAFSALDPLIRREMQDQLIELQQRLHKTIVFITHDLDEALRLGDTIAIMRDGGIEQVGTGEAILQRPATDYVARFVEDVNRGRVLTAGTVKLDCAVVRDAATPKEALHALDRQAQRVTYVVDAAGRLLGALTSAAARRAARENAASIGAFAEKVPAATEDMVLEEVLRLTLETDVPIAVVSDTGAITGMLPRDAIIAALAENAGLNEDADERT
jgi:glycine betaine/proline transport system ATP-binding protein